MKVGLNNVTLRIAEIQRELNISFTSSKDEDVDCDIVAYTLKEDELDLKFTHHVMKLSSKASKVFDVINFLKVLFCLLFLIQVVGSNLHIALSSQRMEYMAQHRVSRINNIFFPIHFRIHIRSSSTYPPTKAPRNRFHNQPKIQLLHSYRRTCIQKTQ